MITLGSLWLPIVASAVLVFVVSSLVHMVFKYHNRDYTKIPNEDAVRAAIRGAKPAQYLIPYCADMKDMGKPEMQQKYVEGPMVVMNVMPNGVPKMGKSLTQWFLFVLIVSFLIGYVAAHTIPPGAAFLGVFRVLGAAGFLAYAAGVLPASIWMGQPWSVACKEVFDGLLYGLVTAATFGWLWPR
jgi:hypothetical protein